MTTPEEDFLAAWAATSLADRVSSIVAGYHFGHFRASFVKVEWWTQIEVPRLHLHVLGLVSWGGGVIVCRQTILIPSSHSAEISKRLDIIKARVANWASTRSIEHGHHTRRLLKILSDLLLVLWHEFVVHNQVCFSHRRVLGVTLSISWKIAASRRRSISCGYSQVRFWYLNF